MDTYSKEPLKRESGLITRHNGIEIIQSAHGIKMHCQTYIQKIIKTKNFNMTTTKHKPLPMDSDSKYMKSLENDIGLSDNDAHAALENSIGFKYMNATGKLIFAMVTCRADIAFHVIKLTQYNSSPANAHYEAVMKVFRFLNATQTNGLTFWRPRPRNNLPLLTVPVPEPDTHKVHIPEESASSETAYGYTDSDLAGDTKTRN